MPDRANKQATLFIIVCNIQTISEKRGPGMDRFDAMRAFARVVEA
ncbi:TPA: LysR family transcriptional regulator, partial [Klebsiella pneumoniae]|nr:LysR family transcriptional regulator [Klebsiella pneumoniae]